MLREFDHDFAYSVITGLSKELLWRDFHNLLTFWESENTRNRLEPFLTYFHGPSILRIYVISVRPNKYLARNTLCNKSFLEIVRWMLKKRSNIHCSLKVWIHKSLVPIELSGKSQTGDARKCSQQVLRISGNALKVLGNLYVDSTGWS